MATINQETRNPSNALERQVQTRVAVVEQLTQRNQELEQQLNQRNKWGPKDQHDERDDEELNRSHLLTKDWWEREDQEESNIPSRQDGQNDIDHSSKIESNAMRMAQDM